MGLFDGMITKFADKLCEHLNHRIGDRMMASAEAREANDSYKVMMNLIIAEALSEIVNAITAIKNQ